jgi:hypothetical protein
VERLGGLWGADEDVFAYFNDDHRACAVRDAIGLARLAARVGLRPSRVPEAAAVQVVRE